MAQFPSDGLPRAVTTWKNSKRQLKEASALTGRRMNREGQGASRQTFWLAKAESGAENGDMARFNADVGGRRLSKLGKFERSAKGSIGAWRTEKVTCAGTAKQHALFHPGSLPLRAVPWLRNEGVRKVNDTEAGGQGRPLDMQGLLRHSIEARRVRRHHWPGRASRRGRRSR
jgi:hypothetical protein